MSDKIELVVIVVGLMTPFVGPLLYYLVTTIIDIIKDVKGQNE